MNVPIDITGDLVSAIQWCTAPMLLDRGSWCWEDTFDWDVVVRLITHRVQTCMHDLDTTPIICVQYYLRDALFKGWASAYLCTHLPRGGDDLRTKLVRWIAKSLNVDIFTNECRRRSVSREAVQRLRDTMIERESLIINGFWVRVVSF